MDHIYKSEMIYVHLDGLKNSCNIYRVYMVYIDIHALYATCEHVQVYKLALEHLEMVPYATLKIMDVMLITCQNP